MEDKGVCSERCQSFYVKHNIAYCAKEVAEEKQKLCFPYCYPIVSAGSRCLHDKDLIVF